MAHDRPRYAMERLKKMLRYSAIVGIFGHRQVGKTYLASELAGSYVSLDNRAELEWASRDPMGFLERFSKRPVVLDECQLCAELFPALKEWVRKDPRPGQFILTGSVRFTSRKAIRESLTGRLVQIELLPMSLGEMAEEPLNDFLPRFMKMKQGLPKPKASFYREKMRARYLGFGGLPGICFIRDGDVRTQKLQTLVETLLERDLRLLLETTLPFQSLLGLYQFLARKQGDPIDWAEMNRKTRISRPTLKKLFYAFESMYLVRQIPTEGDVAKPVFYLEDQGEASYLVPEGYSAYTDLLRLIYANMRLSFLYRPELQPQFFRYQTRSGSEIPLAVRTRDGILGILPSLERTPTRNTLGSAQSFLNNYKRAKVAIIHPQEKGELLSLGSRLASIPIGAI